MMGLLLAGCTSPTSIKFAKAGLPNVKTETVFVATGRKPIGKGDFSGERAGTLQFASYSVSVPPAHQVGKIEWPKGQPDPRRHFAVASIEPLENTAALRQRINAKLATPEAKTPDGKREAFLFVHGYNTDFSESLYRSAQLKHDFDMKVPMTLFSWPSAGKPELYMYDRDSIKASRDQLQSVIELMVRSDADQITLAAHSLGTELLMETLRQMALANKGRLSKKINAVVLISPDLDIDVFNAQLRAIKTLPSQFAIFVSENDQALQISSFLTGDKGRVGNTIDESTINRDGILVVDVTDFDGGDDLNHMTAVTSPQLVAVLKGIAHSGQRNLRKAPGQKSSLAEAVVDTATLPITLVVKTTQAIFEQ